MNDSTCQQDIATSAREVWAPVASAHKAALGTRVFELYEPGTAVQVTAIPVRCTAYERLRYSSMESGGAISAPRLREYITHAFEAAPGCVVDNLYAHLSCKAPRWTINEQQPIVALEPDVGTAQIDNQRVPAVTMGVCEDRVALAAIRRARDGGVRVETHWVYPEVFVRDARGFELLTQHLTWDLFHAGIATVSVGRFADELVDNAALFANPILNAAMTIILDYRVENTLPGQDIAKRGDARHALTRAMPDASPGELEAIVEQTAILASSLAQFDKAVHRRSMAEVVGVASKMDAEKLVEEIAATLGAIGYSTGLCKGTRDRAARQVSSSLDAWMDQAMAHDPRAKALCRDHANAARLACIAALHDPVLSAHYMPGDGDHSELRNVLRAVQTATRVDDELPPLASSYLHAALAALAEGEKAAGVQQALPLRP